MNKFLSILPIDDNRSLLVNCLDRSIVAVRQSSIEGSKNSVPSLKQYNISDFRQWFHNITQDTSEIKAILFLTTKCNLACRYCFQDGYTKDQLPDLSIATADMIITWLIDFGHLNKSNVIHLYLYGGEPSLNPELVEYLATKGKQKLEEAGFQMVGHMFTNGAILNDKVFSAIRSGAIRFLQITLDGSREIHDRRRPFNGGKGSYSKIVENLIRITSETDAEITLLSNFDRENIDSIKELHHSLANIGLAEKLFFTSNPVFQTTYNCNPCNSFSFPDDECFRTWSDLMVDTFDRGLHCNPLPIFERGPCSYWRRSHFIFDTTGTIHKCIGMPSITDYSIGDVYSLSPKNVSQFPAKHISGIVWENDICLKCSYLPLCLGGCRFHALVEHNDVTKPYCHKELIEECEFATIKNIYGRNTDLPG